jgi:hypothetical protein
VSVTPNQISDDEVPRLHVTSPPQPVAHAAAPLPADSDAEVPLPLLGVSRLSSSPPLLSFTLPYMLAAAADTLSGMVNSRSLLLLSSFDTSMQ